MKFSNLQSLRGIAALLVLLFHATGLSYESYQYVYMGNLFKQGYIGVDLFFVLSGFIIAYMHWSQINLKNGVVIKYLLKRFFRIYPLYWIMVTPLIIVYFVYPSLGDPSIRMPLNIIKSIALYPQQSSNAVIAVAWTLSYEIVFYTVFGVLLVVGNRLAIGVLFTWVISIVLISMKVSSFNDYALSCIFSTVNLEFILGCFIGNLVSRHKILEFNLSVGLLCFGLLILFLSYGLSYVNIVKINSVVAYGVPFTIIVYSLVCMEISKVSTSPKILTVLGDASYSIYLTHYTSLSFLSKVFIKLQIVKLFGNLFAINIIILCAILIGLLTHFLLEKPLLKITNTLIFKLSTKSA